MEWGNRRKDLEHLAETAGFIPAALENEPALPFYLQAYLDGFRTLNAARTFTIAATATKAIRLPNPLAVSEILRVSEEYGLPSREFLIIAQALDQTYLERELARL